MQVHQKLKVLFYRKNSKKDKNGILPIYCRVTIDGFSVEISTGCKIPFEDWDTIGKTVVQTNTQHKIINKKLRQIQTDLERHFDLVVATHQIATPKRVIASFQSAVHGERSKKDKEELNTFSLQMDDMIKEVFKYERLIEKVEKDLAYAPQFAEKIRCDRHLLENRLAMIVKQGAKIFEDKNREKTLCMAIEEFQLDFLQHVMADARSTNTLKKKFGTKRRLKEFIYYQYKRHDLPLAQIETRFITEFVKREVTQYRSAHNTVWKYVQIINEIIDRAVAKGWISHNMFATFRYSYQEPLEKSWPKLEEVISLSEYIFAEEHKELEAIRDIFIYQCFAGPSYAELYALNEGHLSEVDGKVWVKQKRRKSKSLETIPLLPICLQIIEKYKNHPKTQHTGKLLPVPTGQYYNRCLKIIGEITGISCLTNSHQARYFFANELAYAASNDFTITGLLMGQRNFNSVKTYVKPTQKQISAGMTLIEEKLYGENGKLNKNKHPNSSAKIIDISLYRFQQKDNVPD